MIRLVSEELANQAFQGLESRRPGEPWAIAFAYAVRPGASPRSGHLGIRRFAPGVGHLQVWEDVKAKGYSDDDLHTSTILLAAGSESLFDKDRRNAQVLRSLPREVRDRLLEELRKRIPR